MRLIRFKYENFTSLGEERQMSSIKSRVRHAWAVLKRRNRNDENMARRSSSRKKAPSTNFWTWKRQTHSHKAYRHRMARVRRSNRSHAPGGSWSKWSRSWF